MLRADDFWQYSLRIYAVEEVKQQCLALQNTYGLNVNMLLFCGFLTQHNIYLDTGTFKFLSQQIEKIDQQLKVLRTNRNKVKSESRDLYIRVLEQELDLEKSQQATLISRLNNQFSKDTELNHQQNDNFISYYHSMEQHDEQLLEDITSIKILIMSL